MAEGLSVVLPLTVSERDGTYALHDSLRTMAQQNIKMVVLTSPGERVMDPHFGVGIRKYLFHPALESVGDIVSSRVKEQAAIYLPYVRIQSVDSKVYADSNSLFVKVRYSIPSVGVVDEFEFPVSA